MADPDIGLSASDLVAVQRMLGASDCVSMNGSNNRSKWLAALGRVIAGTGRGRYVVGGDSRTVGAGAGTGSQNTDGARTKSISDVVARQMAARGIPTNTQCYVGHKNLNTLAQVEAYLPVTHGAGWSISGAANGFATFNCASPGVGTQTWTFASAVDTIEIISVNASGFGTFTATLDSDPTVIATVNSNATTGYQNTKVTVALATHALKLQRTTGGDIRILGVIGYNSAVPAVDVINLGGYGQTSTGWNNTGSLSLGGIQAAFGSVDLFTLDIGTNDKLAGTANSVVQTNLTAIATAIKAVSDFGLIVPTPLSIDTPTTLAAFSDMFKQVATSANCMLYDESTRFGSYASALALGLMFDVTHQSAPGYAHLGIGLAKALTD